MHMDIFSTETLIFFLSLSLRSSQNFLSGEDTDASLRGGAVTAIGILREAKKGAHRSWNSISVMPKLVCTNAK